MTQVEQIQKADTGNFLPQPSSEAPSARHETYEAHVQVRGPGRPLASGGRKFPVSAYAPALSERTQPAQAWFAHG